MCAEPLNQDETEPAEPRAPGRVAQSSAGSNSAAMQTGSAAESLNGETLRCSSAPQSYALRQPRLDPILRNWSVRVRDAARAAAFEGLPGLAAAALEIESRGLGPARIPHLFARDLTQIPPTLNDDLLELYGRSEQALATRLSFHGEAQQFDAALEWERPCGRAWRVELHSFDFALDLALTFRISGDDCYARHQRYFLADWVASNPPAGGTGWAAWALARRIRNWILAADLAREAFERDTEFLELFGSSLAQQATYLGWITGSLDEERTVWAASRALLLASRCFPSGRGAGLYDASADLMSSAAGDGAEIFRRPAQPLRQFELAAAWCDHVLFAVEPSTNKRAQGEFMCSLGTLEGMLHPDGTLPLFGPEPLPSAGAVAELFALGAAVLGVARWKGLCGGELGILPYMLLGESGKRGMEALPPETWRANSRLDAETGILRLSDGQSSAMLVNAQPAVSAADHEDVFSYELTVCGQRTVVDSGIFAPPGEEAGDAFAAARAHNVLLVDGALPCGGGCADVRVAGLCTSGAVQGFWLQAGGAGQRDTSALGGLLAEAYRPGRGITRQRGFFLINCRYWVVLDRLSGSGTHRIENFVHFFPAYGTEVRDCHAVARSGAASVTISPIGAAAKPAKSVSIRNTSEAIWHAPTPGVRYPNCVVTVEWPAAELPWIGGYVIGPAEDMNLNTNGAWLSSDGGTLNFGGESHSLNNPLAVDENAES